MREDPLTEKQEKEYSEKFWKSLEAGDFIDIDLVNTVFAILERKSGYTNIVNTKTKWVAEMIVEGLGTLIIENEEGYPKSMILDKKEENTKGLFKKLEKKHETKLQYGVESDYQNLVEEVDKIFDELQER